MSTGIYIYCFIKEKEKLTLCGSSIGNKISPVYTLPYKDISAVVSETGIFEYNPTRKYLLAHQHVITKVMEKYSPVPVTFGTVGNSESKLKKIMAENYAKLTEQLDFFQDKMELGLRVTWDDEAYIRDIEDEDIRELKEKVSGKEEDEVLPDKIQLGKLVEAATLAKKEEYTKKIYKPLTKAAVMSKLKETVPIKTVFSAYFLINKARSDDFDDLVGKLCKPYEKRLGFSYTGPWPPYNFTDLKLNLSADTENQGG
jgi:hypothetical protein